MAEQKRHNLIGISGKIGSGKDTLAKMIQMIICEGIGSTRIVDPKRILEWFDPFANPSGWHIKKFADKLKDIICILIGCTRAQLEDPIFKASYLPSMWDYIVAGYSGGKEIRLPASKRYINIWPNAKRYQMTVREMLQWAGTDCMRDHLHMHTWINALFSSYLKPFVMVDVSDTPLYNGEIQLCKWVITDVRFEDEVEAIKERDGIIIRMEAGIGVAGTIMSWNKEGQRSSIGLLPTTNPHESEIALDHYLDWDYYVDNTGTLTDLYEHAKTIVEKFNLV